ncbi:NEDD8-activating enzyme E1 regulatory subunit AXR1 [Linum perenne]
MVDESSVGQPKAKCVCAFLQELNDAVKAKFIEEYPEALIETNPSFFSQFTLVVATQLAEDSMIKLDKICREANVMLIFARSYGLAGLVRISVKEHVVIESKPDHFLDDLRLNNPWPELKSFAEKINLNMADPVAHKHTPYVVILERLRGKMVSADEDNYKEAMDASFKVFAPRGINPELRQIIDDSCVEYDYNSSDFWVMVAALKEFIMNEGGGETPLEGSIPDMTSSTEVYVSLQKIYQRKAEADFLVIEEKVRRILRELGSDLDSISRSVIKTFCKNARKLKVCRYRLVEDEFNNPSLSELQRYLSSPDYSYAVGFYILLRAVDRFAANYKVIPGQYEGSLMPSCREIDEDIARLKSTAVTLLNDLGCNASPLNDDLVSEIWRYAGSELHAVAAFIGGVASQEVIKLITKQFVPMSGTFIFNGIDHKSQILSL